ncbi:hypothetical protein E1301_Tti014665 [Triplophysa tibetana]|uniref:Uncharacterized protein n=1 Tax=Triplophysa tibetana TaxID=1572043 RepID=A0A5A9PKF3_9TELE|nr:hypothetical protein E1301_Tti014665 [Triplophysa tibetana]
MAGVGCYNSSYFSLLPGARRSVPDGNSLRLQEPLGGHTEEGQAGNNQAQCSWLSCSLSRPLPLNIPVPVCVTVMAVIRQECPALPPRPPCSWMKPPSQPSSPETLAFTKCVPADVVHSVHTFDWLESTTSRFPPSFSHTILQAQTSCDRRRPKKEHLSKVAGFDIAFVFRNLSFMSFLSCSLGPICPPRFFCHSFQHRGGHQTFAAVFSHQLIGCGPLWSSSRSERKPSPHPMHKTHSATYQHWRGEQLEPGMFKDYREEFLELSHLVPWNDATLETIFWNGLDDNQQVVLPSLLHHLCMVLLFLWPRLWTIKTSLLHKNPSQLQSSEDQRSSSQIIFLPQNSAQIHIHSFGGSQIPFLPMDLPQFLNPVQFKLNLSLLQRSVSSLLQAYVKSPLQSSIKSPLQS